MKIDNSPPRGTRDLLPDSTAVRDHVLVTITEIYHQFGYQRIETPALEDLQRLTNGQGGENEKLIFQVRRRGLPARIELNTEVCELTDLGLRFDLTVPLTRFYGNNHHQLPMAFHSVPVLPVRAGVRSARPDAASRGRRGPLRHRRPREPCTRTARGLRADGQRVATIGRSGKFGAQLTRLASWGFTALVYLGADDDSTAHPLIRPLAERG
ncbi:MAG: ATP phosphoribosyltransferase regulatory subunit [Pseudonocardiaceae bacterium]